MNYTRPSRPCQRIVAAQIPQELRDRHQWILWKTIDRGGKPTKVPFRVGGQPAKSNDPSTWTTFPRAWNSRGQEYGLGFVFAPDDPYVGIDLDGCRDPETGQVEPWARTILDRLQTYCEVSPSGTGVKLWVKAKLPRAGYKTKPGSVPGKPRGGKEPGIEVYASGRYFAVTGWRLLKYPRAIREVDLGWLLEKYFPEQPPEPCSSGGNGVLTSAFERARRYVAKCPPAISGQRGHDRTFRVACILRKGFALSEEEALRILLEDYNPRCQPPWSEKELRHKVEDAGKVGGPEGYMLHVVDENYSRVRIPKYKWHPQPESGEDQAKPVLRPISEFARREVRWHWQDHLPLGKLVLLCGRPGVGKSMVALDWAARTSAGQNWPDGQPCEPGSVLLMAREDDPHDTIRPRLEAAGADLDVVQRFSGAKVKDVELPVTLADAQILAEALQDLEARTSKPPRLVIVDTLGSFLGSGVDAYRENEVRPILEQLADLAREWNVVMLLIVHRRKASKDNAGWADDQVLGSVAFTAVPRVVWHVQVDPENREQRLLLPGKCNLAPGNRGWVFQITGPFPGRIEWLEQVNQRADDVAEAPSRRGPAPKKRELAEQIIAAGLAGGPAPAERMLALLKAAGIGKKTIQEAKEKLGVETYQQDRKHWWLLP